MAFIHKRQSADDRDERINEVTNTGKHLGRPEISNVPVDQFEFKTVCPVGAIGVNPERIDLGRCVFCGACAERFPSKVRFTGDFLLATNIRDRLIVFASEKYPIRTETDNVRAEVRSLSGHTIRLKVLQFPPDDGFQFDQNALRTSGIELVDHKAHGIVIIGRVLPESLAIIKETYDTLLQPKLMILSGTDAINSSDGLAERFPVDLCVPGSPVHAITFVNGILEITQQ